MKKNIIILTVMLLALTFSSCGKRTQGHDEHDHTKENTKHNTETKEDHHENEIVFTPAQAEAVGLKLDTIKPESFQQVIKTSGQIQAAQGDEATIVATANGVVSFANAIISDGSAVSSGQPILIISAKNLAEGDPYVKARLAFETAHKEYKRAESLVKDRIISVKEFEETQLRYENAKLAFNAHSGNVSAKGIRINSPMTGYIKNRLVNQGDYVSVGQPLATVSKNKRLQLRAEVSEKYFKNLSGINSANFKMSYDNKLYKLSELNGRLISFGKSSNQSSFYIPVIFEFDNIGYIVPGSFAEIFLLANKKENVFKVPISALIEEQGLFFVYIQIDAEGYRKQEVTIGQGDGEYVQILSGLKEGDRVVTKGAYDVKLASASSVIPEGHSH